MEITISDLILSTSLGILGLKVYCLELALANTRRQMKQTQDACEKLVKECQQMTQAYIDAEDSEEFWMAGDEEGWDQ